MAFTAKILSWHFCHLDIVGSLLKRRPTKGGTPGPPPPPSYAPGLKKYYLDWSYPEVITKFSRMDRLPNFLSDSAPLARKELCYKPWIISPRFEQSSPDCYNIFVRKKY